jgi:biotin carboxyl carrier protein
MNGPLKWLLIVLVVCGIVYFILPLFTSHETPLNAAGAGGAGSLTVPAPAAAPKSADLGAGATELEGNILTAVTSIEAEKRTAVTARTAGIIVSLPLRQGSVAPAGSVLCETSTVADPRDIQFALEKARLGKSESDERVRKAKSDNKSREDKTKLAVEDAKAAVSDAQAKLRQSELDQAVKNRRTQQAVADAELAFQQTASKFRRALLAYNICRSLAKLTPVAEPADLRNFTGTVVAARPADKPIDDTLQKANDYIEAELALRDAEGSLVAARGGIKEAERQVGETRETLELSVGVARFKLVEAQRDLDTANKAIADLAEQIEIATNLAKSDQDQADVALRQALSRAENSKITVAAEDGGSLVAELFVQAGDIVGPGQKIATLSDPNRLVARIVVPVVHLPLFQKLTAKNVESGGGPLTVRVEAAALESAARTMGAPASPIFTGTVRQWSRVVSPSALGFTVEIALDASPTNLDGEWKEVFRLQPGMVAMLKFDLSAALPAAKK